MAEEPGAGGIDFRRILLLAGVLIVVGGAGVFMFFRSCGAMSSSTKNYTTIYTNLDLKDAANVVARLKEIAIPYEIKDEGRAIAVPKEKSDQARLGLAEKSLPMGGAVGWEIFDQSKLGATDFDRRIQLIRAISGELARTIRCIQAVEDVRVQIVMPETKLFSATTAPVTASVLLRIKPGAELSPEKINGIVHLVASSVENLQIENVTVIDNYGRILTGKNLSGTRGVVIEQIEQPPLTPVPSVETVVVKTKLVSAEAPAPKALPKTDLAKTKEASAPVVAQKGVVSKEVTPVAPISAALSYEEKMLSKVRAKKELENDLAAKAQEVLNRFYPPNSVIVKVNLDLESVDTLPKNKKDDLKPRRLTAIILVDNRLTLKPELKESTLKAVAGATGYNRYRGDQILLQKVPFHLATPAPENMNKDLQKSISGMGKAKNILPSLNYVYIGLGAAGILILALIVMRTRKNKKEAFTPAIPEPMPAPPPVTPPPPAARPSVIDNIRSAVEQDPERAAELLKGWLTK